VKAGGWDQCTYIQGKLAQGHSISRGDADARRIYLDKHLLPYFRDKKLTNIKSRDVEEWVTKLTKKEGKRGGLLSNATTISASAP
jgi:hypothetical protein